MIKTNIKDLPDEKLIELCAEAQGWEIHWVSDYPSPHKTGGRYWRESGNGDVICLVSNYNPLANTQAGKAQAMELVERFNIHAYPPTEQEPRWWAVIRHSGGGESENIQHAIVLAVVASKYGDIIEYDGGEV